MSECPCTLCAFTRAGLAAILDVKSEEDKRKLTIAASLILNTLYPGEYCLVGGGTTRICDAAHVIVEDSPANEVVH